MFHIENPNELTQVAHLRPGDYPSAGYPFETHGDVYVGGNLAPDRQEVSLKYGFYPLAYANGLDDYQDDMLEQYLLVRPLMDRKNDVRFLARLRQGISELLAVLYEDVKQVCKSEGLKVTRIGLSIPSQWTMEFMEVYADIASDVFVHPKDAIFFHTETEALAHFLLKESLLTIQARPDDAYSVFLFLDFGGHNMVSLSTFAEARLPPSTVVLIGCRKKAVY